MHTGMLWFDNSKCELEVKIKKGLEYYAKKYGRNPDLVLVNPSMFRDDASFGVLRIDVPFFVAMSETVKVLVRPYRPILPGHIWIGIEDKE